MLNTKIDRNALRGLAAGAIAAGGLAACATAPGVSPAPQAAQTTSFAAVNPCNPCSVKPQKNPCAANPCAAAEANPCAAAAANPCAAEPKANPCAAGPANPCAANPCAAAKVNPCSPA